MSQAMDMVLGKSEELVDRFLPMSEAELGTDQRGLGLAQGCTAQHSTPQQRETWNSNPGWISPSIMHLRKSDTLNPKDTWGFCIRETSLKLVALKTAQ